ncbi:hypothetical protein [Methanoculleus sp.]|uniref:hypothetical protein n=1 Tax=Methanoculleus sp. TaxID=90427 RepID=UPI0025F93355|nr:hypothetical protein [Methanoculleus sp.]
MKISDPFLNGKCPKFLLTLGFILILYNLLILYSHQPQGYAVDIYSVLPLSFYSAAILCYLISSIALLSGRERAKKLGVLLLILNHAVILLIPYMLGYYSMGRADDMSYIGEYLHISKTGFTNDEWNIYPGSLILGAALSMMSGLPVSGAAFVMPVIFSFILVGGLYLCCRFFLKGKNLMNIAILSSFILYLGPYNFLNVPHALFFAYMPLYIFILSRYINKAGFSNAILLILPTILVPFMHPFIVLFVFALLLSLILSGGLLNRFIHERYWRAAHPLTISIMGFLAWFVYCDALMGSLRINFQSYLLKITEPSLLMTTEKIARINIDLPSMMKLLFVYYGRYLIPFIIIGIALILIRLKQDKITQAVKNRMYFFSAFYIALLIIEAIIFLNPMFSHQPDRLTNLNFMLYAQVPLFVLSLSVVFAAPKFFNRQTALVLIILTGMWSLGLFGTFDSPNIFVTNAALTHNEVEGIEWYYEARTGENTIVPVSQIQRFHDLFDDGGIDNEIQIPDHFGYNSSHRTFADINLEPDQQGYVILLNLDELLYQEVPGYREVGRYTAGDYAWFRSDRSIRTKVYDNRDIEIYST